MPPAAHSEIRPADRPAGSALLLAAHRKLPPAQQHGQGWTTPSTARQQGRGPGQHSTAQQHEWGQGQGIHSTAQQHAQGQAGGNAAQQPQQEHTHEQCDCIRERQKKIRAAKRAARSELSVSRGDWRKHGYAQSDILSVEGVKDNIPRVHCSKLSTEEFISKYERPRIPVVITGLTDSWHACQAWDLQQLAQSHAECKFKVGSDDEGYAVRLRLHHYLEYCADKEHSQDDSPLYIFDGSFVEKSSHQPLSSDYRVPHYFREDLFQYVGEKKRPPYRWLVIGPARSGSFLHIDPLATNAWNALLHGHKRWAFFPPGTPRHLVTPKLEGLEREAVSWFTHVYPATQAPSWPTARPLDLIQRPGETVFVPGGWWHAVLNLDMTVAVTHNYACTANFPKVWAHTCKGRPKMSVKWLSQLRAARPELARLADEINRQGCLDCATSSSSSSSSSDDSSSSSSSTSDDEEVAEPPRKRHHSQCPIDPHAVSASLNSCVHVECGPHPGTYTNPQEQQGSHPNRGQLLQYSSCSNSGQPADAQEPERCAQPHNCSAARCGRGAAVALETNSAPPLALPATPQPQALHLSMPASAVVAANCGPCNAGAACSGGCHGCGDMGGSSGGTSADVRRDVAL